MPRVALPRWKKITQWLATYKNQSRLASWGAIGLFFFLVTALTSAGTALILGVIAAAIVGTHRLSARFPEAVGTVLSVGTVWLVAVIAAVTMAPIYIADGAVELTAGLLLAPAVPAVYTWMGGVRGVHRGWTTLLATVPTWVALVATIFSPGLVTVGAGLAMLAGLIVVRMRRGMAVIDGGDTPVGWRRRGVRALAVAGIVAMSVMLMSMAVAPKSEAGWISNIGDKMLCGIVSPSLSAQPVGTGPEQFIASYNNTGLRGADGSDATHLDRELDFGDKDLDNYTLYEIAGLRGISYVNWVKDDAGENTGCAFMPWVSVLAGNGMNLVGHFFLQITIFLMEFSQVKDPFRFLYEPLTPAVGMMVSIAVALMVTALVIGGILMAVRIFRGSSMSEALRNVSGATVAVFILGLFYGGVGVGATWDAPKGSGFYTLMSTLDGYGSAISAGISEGMLSVIPSSESSMCNRPADGGSVELRYTTCLLAESMAYQPWSLGQFGPAGAQKIEPINEPASPMEGQSDDAESLGLPCYNDYQDCSDLRTYLIAQVGGPQTNIEVCLRENGYDEEANDVDNFHALSACEPYHAVANDLQIRGNDSQLMLASYQGSGGSSSHVTQAFVSLLSIFTIGLAIAFVAAATIYWQGRMLMLFLLGAFTLTLAAFSDSRKAIEWMLDLTQTVVVRVGYSFATSLMILIVASVSSTDLNAGIKLLINGFLIANVLKVIRKIDVATSIGGSNSGNAADALSKSNIFQGAAAGAVVGNAISAAPGALKSSAATVGRGTKAAAVVSARGVGRAAEFTSRPARHVGESYAGRNDARKEAAASAKFPAEEKEPSKMSAMATTVGTSVGRSFQRPDGLRRERAHSEHDVYLQEKQNVNDQRNRQEEDVLSLTERRRRRKEIRKLDDSDLMGRYENPDQQAARLAQRKLAEERAAKLKAQNKRKPTPESDQE